MGDEGVSRSICKGYYTLVDESLQLVSLVLSEGFTPTPDMISVIVI
jgi:hypothetical protein